MGAKLHYLPTGRVLRLPQVVIGTATHPGVSLTQPGLEVLGACAQEGIGAKRSTTEDRCVAPTSPGWAPGRRR